MTYETDGEDPPAQHYKRFASEDHVITSAEEIAVLCVALLEAESSRDALHVRANAAEARARETFDLYEVTDARLEQAEAELAKTKEQLETWQREAAALREISSKLNRHKDDIEAELRSVYTSRSWRYTAFLRAVLSRLNGGK